MVDFDIVGERANGVPGVQSHSQHPLLIRLICNAVNTPPTAVTAEITMAAIDTGSDIIIYFLLFFGMTLAGILPSCLRSDNVAAVFCFCACVLLSPFFDSGLPDSP